MPGWASDETIEALRTQWFAAADEAQRRDLADKIQRRAFAVGLYLRTGQYVARRAFRSSLTGIPDSPIPVVWNIEKRQPGGQETEAPTLWPGKIWSAVVRLGVWHRLQ